MNGLPTNIIGSFVQSTKTIINLKNIKVLSVIVREA